MSTKSVVKVGQTYVARGERKDTAKTLQVVGAGGLVLWAAVSIIPFFPVLMALLVLAGVVMKMKS